MALRYEVGDATAPTVRPAIIVHVVNDGGMWGAGFSGAVSRRWKSPEILYRERYRTVGLLLGTVHSVEVAPALWVVNMVAQHGIRRRPSDPPAIRYEPLRMCLEQVAKGASGLGASLHLPRIGAGLAGGDWAAIEPIIAEACAEVPVTVYDLPGA